MRSPPPPTPPSRLSPRQAAPAAWSSQHSCVCVWCNGARALECSLLLSVRKLWDSPDPTSLCNLLISHICLVFLVCMLRGCDSVVTLRAGDYGWVKLPPSPAPVSARHLFLSFDFLFTLTHISLSRSTTVKEFVNLALPPLILWGYLSVCLT